MATLKGKQAWERITQALNAGNKPKASDFKIWAESQQGWILTQTANGPLKYEDKKGVIRLTLKQGSSRTPGSNHPHVELRHPQNYRIEVDRKGRRVTRKSPENHTPIDWDI